MKEDQKDFLDIIKSYSIVKEYPEQHVLLNPGDRKRTLFYIYYGRVSLSAMSYDGSTKIIYFLDSDSFICELDYFLDCASTLVVKTEMPCILYKIPFKNYDYLWNNSPIFQEKIVTTLSKKVHSLQNEISSISFRSVQHRILSFLYSIRLEEKSSDPSWADLKYNYTQTQLAEIVGSNRATVNREIAKLCNSGYLRKLNNQVQVNIIKKPPNFI